MARRGSGVESTTRRPWATLAEVEQRAEEIEKTAEGGSDTKARKEAVELYIEALHAVARGAPRARQIAQTVLRMAEAVHPNR
ncbi:MAG: hypothetical protein ACLF0P_12190 [Thermoanaerobaculia bacterium]